MFYWQGACYSFDQLQRPLRLTRYKNTHLTTIYKTKYLITTRHLTGQITRLITRQTYRFPYLWIINVKNVFQR